MKRKGLRFILLVVALLLLPVTAYAERIQMDLNYNGQNHAYDAEKITITIDGKKIEPTDVPAVAIDGRTMLPMRQIAQELGCEVIWHEAAKQVYVINETYTLVFTIGNLTGQQNGIDFMMDVPPMLINDRTMLPVRALATALELEIAWDDPTRTVAIRTKQEEQPIEPTEPIEPMEPTEPIEPPIENQTQTSSGKDFDEVSLRKLSVPADLKAGQGFVIQASGKIAEWSELDISEDKIVLDFYKVQNALPEKTEKTNSAFVSAIRTAQHTTQEGITYTRVVFDLLEKQDYEVMQSSDGTQVLVMFDQIDVSGIYTDQEGEKDVIQIEGDGALGAEVFVLSGPARIVVDIPNAKSDLPEDLNISGLQHVFAGRSGMFTDTTLRIVFETDDLIAYEYEEDDEGGVLTVWHSDLDHMRYDAFADCLYLEKIEAFDTEGVAFDDCYLDGYFDVVLPVDMEEIYGHGVYQLGDDVIEEIEVFTKNGETTLRFWQNRISCYQLEDLGEQYVIYAKNPKEVYDKVLLLDAGHGGKDPGAIANGIMEKEMTLKMLQQVNRLIDDEIKVYLTRDTDVYPENNLRAKMANEIADAMVSIHMNAAENQMVNGTETLYKVHENDTGETLTSKQLAEIIQNSIILETGNNNRGIKHRADLLILNGTTVPTVIVEVIFLTNAGDALKIMQEEYQLLVAGAIADGIEEAFTYELR